MTKKIALIVGHYVHGKDKGAVNYLGETESSFNHRICKELQHQLKINRVDSKIFLRDDHKTITGVGRAVSEYKPEISIEFHFNSHSSKSFGCEVLATVEDYWSITVADIITDYIEDYLNIKQRGDKSGVLLISKGGRGFGNLDAVKGDFAKVLIEPCFANIKTPDSQAIFEDESRYIECLRDAILYILSGHSKIIDMRKMKKSPDGAFDLIKNLLSSGY